MRVVVENTINNTRVTAYEGESGFVIGSGPRAKVRLASERFVWPEHAGVERRGDSWVLSVRSGADAVSVDGVEVRPGGERRLAPVSSLHIAFYVITLDSTMHADAPPDAFAELHRLEHDLHNRLLDHLRDQLSDGSARPTPRHLEVVNTEIDRQLQGDLRHRVFADDAMRARLLVLAVQLRLEMLAAQHAPDPRDASAPGRIDTPGRSALMEHEADRALDQVRRRAPGLAPAVILDGRGETALEEAVRATSARMSRPLIEYLVGQLLKKRMCDLIFGLGPLQDLLDAPGITEIMVVEPTVVYIERDGRILPTNRTFVDDKGLKQVIDRILEPINRTLDRANPSVDARVNGARVHAVIPPIALRGPCLTIRRFAAHLGTLDSLSSGPSPALSGAGAALLRAAVLGSKNILIAGGTGAGKTTLLNALGRTVPAGHRIITIEDSAELRLNQAHAVPLEARRPNGEGAGEVNIRDLVREALRMRPDRIIVGECRGGEALDMLQAMNTGHSGCMTTLHANSAQDIVPRLETLVSSAVPWPPVVIRQQIAQAIDLVVHIGKTEAGRRVLQISEILGVDPVTEKIEIADVLAADHDFNLRPTGWMPTFLPDLVAAGHLSPSEWLEETPA